MRFYQLIIDDPVTPLRDGEPCSHRGCLNHVTHPCEGCGRVAGRTIVLNREVYPKVERPEPQPATFYVEGHQFCEVEGCEFCACVWAGTGRCFPHSIELLGEPTMKLLYESTHDITWEEFRK